MVEQFHKPTTIQEALSLKRRLATRAVFLAGGTLANAKDCPVRPEQWISLAGLKLDRIDQRRGDLIIGALCTLQQLIEDARTPEPLRAAAAQIMSRNVRNMATVGGHVAANLPYSDLIPMLIALGARVELPGPRLAKTISVLDYITAGITSGSASGARIGATSGCPAGCDAGRPSGCSLMVTFGKTRLITRIVVPRLDRRRLAACGNVRGSANARSLLSAAVSLTATDDGIQDPIIALAGVGQHVVRLASAEKALNGKPLPSIDRLAAMISRCVRPASTPFASAPYIKHQAGVVVTLAFQKALLPKEDPRMEIQEGLRLTGGRG
jgi:CO/xanthine dehydrogenase FAD-binding subunit